MSARDGVERGILSSPVSRILELSGQADCVGSLSNEISIILSGEREPDKAGLDV